MWTDRNIRSFQPKSSRYRVSDDLGQKGAGRLVLDVQPNGTKTFFYQYYRSENGKSKRTLIKVGVYRNSDATPGISLSDARAKALELSHVAESGDVKRQLKAETEEKERKAKQKKFAAATLREVLEDYIESKDLKPVTVKDYRYAIHDAFPAYLDRPITDVDRETILHLYRQESRRSVARANNSMRVFRAIYNYQRAITRLTGGSYLLPENPHDILREAKVLRKIPRRQTYIPREDLKHWFQCVLELDDRRYTSGTTFRDYLIFLLLTGARREEARTLRREHINLWRQVFRLVDTKNREVVELPMSDYLTGVVTRRMNAVDSEYLFAGLDPNFPIVSFKRPLEHFRKDHNLQFTFHDLRRTFITIAESLDISGYTIKKLVNHKIDPNSDVTAGYMIIDIDRMRVATQKITDAILRFAEISHEVNEDNVVSIHNSVSADKG